MASNQRMARYLIKMYNGLSEREQNRKLDEILKRLSQYSWANRELLDKSVSLAKKNWPMAEVLAYFDLLDIEERT